MAVAEELKRWLADETGLDPALLSHPSLDRLIERRLIDLGLRDQQAYQEWLGRSRDELEQLVQEVSVAETSFFRYPQSFKLLVRHLTDARSHPTGAILRMLSVACATGEEAYSMAIAAAHAGWPLERIMVDAVDRHKQSLEVARRARYRQKTLHGALPAWARPWMHPVGDQLQVDPRLCRVVQFVHADILKSPLPRPSLHYEVIFCRNLFIYLGPRARRQLARSLAEWLSPRGLLFVGHAEHLDVLREYFQVVPVPHAFAMRRKARETLAEERKPADSAQAPLPREQGSVAGGATLASLPLRCRPQSSRGAAEGAWHPLKARSGDPTIDRGLEHRDGLPPDGHRESRSASSLEPARRLADSGRLNEARAAIEDLLSEHPPTVELYALLGSVRLGLGELPEARDAFLKVVYLDPYHEASLLQLAGIFERLGNAEQARRYRRRASQAFERSRSHEPAG